MLKVKEWDGKSVRMPSLVSRMNIDFYHSADAAIEPSISSTGLRKIMPPGSPKHYWANSVYNPKAEEDEETEALILGRAAHHRLFSQSGFEEAFVVRPARLGANREGSPCRIWIEERRAEGKTILTETQFEHIEGIAKSLANDPAVKAGALNGRIEESYFWKDKKTGIWLKTRPDANPTADLSFVDLKVTRSTEWSYLVRAIRTYSYYQQAALMATACLELHARPMDSFSFLFVENKPPYDIEFVMIKDNEIDRGIRANRVALDRFAECLKSGKWPGRRGERAEPKYIEMREYDQKDVDFEIGAAKS
jgi:hypothetical protein